MNYLNENYVEFLGEKKKKKIVDLKLLFENSDL